MKNKLILGLAFSLFSVLNFASADSLVGLSTDGTIYQINQSTGELTDKAFEQLSSFSLGGTTRKGGNFFYVAEPSGGGGENHIFKAKIGTGEISHVDLDRAGGDDQFRDLFFVERALYGVHYNGNTGAAGVYKINPRTGATTLKVDLSGLDAEPLPGAFSKLGDFFYILMKPDSEPKKRLLVKFKIKAGSARSKEIKAADDSDVSCERIALNQAPNKPDKFICLAAPSATEVNVCKLLVSGRATCAAEVLPNIERVAGGATLFTKDNTSYQALVYELGDADTQRLIKFNAKGTVRTTSSIIAILIGAHFSGEPVS